LSCSGVYPSRSQADKWCDPCPTTSPLLELNSNLVLYVKALCDCHWYPQKYNLRWLLTDFGFTTANDGSIQTSVGRRGTPGFRAPELLDLDTSEDHGQFSRKSDIWAMGCILFRLATTAKKSAFKNDGSVLVYSQGYGICPQIDEVVNPSLRREIYCPDEESKTSCLSQINSLVALCLTLEPSARATTMKLKVTFERMKAYLIDDMTKEERNRWL